jgi:hypothetical protein
MALPARGLLGEGQKYPVKSSSNVIEQRPSFGTENRGFELYDRGHPIAPIVTIMGSQSH